MNVYNCLGLKCIILLLKTTNLQELSSRTMFYHSQMMNAQKSKILANQGSSVVTPILRPFFLRKTYKSFFGINPIQSVVGRALPRVRLSALGPIYRIETSELSRFAVRNS